MGYKNFGGFDDTLVRNKIIEFYGEMFDIKLEATDPNKRLIDLVCVDDPEKGVEVEHGKWSGDFWTCDNYSLISNHEFRTVNIPIRKEKYWLKEYVSYRKLRQNPSYLKNEFARTNADFSQIILIMSDVIRDPEKLVRSSFQPNNNNEVEEWLSFRREHVKTYNLKDNKYILDDILQ